MSDLTKLQAVSALPRARVALCLNSELRAELDELERALAGELGKEPGEDGASNQTLAEPSRATDLAARLADVKARALEATVEFEFTALKRSTFAALEEEHPAKDGGEYTFDFWCALISASLTSHSLSVDETRTWLEDSLSQGQVDKLILTALSVNRESGETRIPFSVSGSAPNR
jgi:hypothetical protein